MVRTRLKEQEVNCCRRTQMPTEQTAITAVVRLREESPGKIGKIMENNSKRSRELETTDREIVQEKLGKQEKQKEN